MRISLDRGSFVGKLCAYLMSKMVLVGFIAAKFLAASPINRSSSVNETKEGVVKLPCSLATAQDDQQ